MTEVKLFKFTYSPLFKKGSIRGAQFFIVAEDMDKAKKIAESECWKYFDQDLRVEVSSVMEGYQDYETMD